MKVTDGNMQMVENNSDEPGDISSTQTEVLLTSESGHLVDREILTFDSKDMTGITEVDTTVKVSGEPVDNSSSQQTDSALLTPKSGALIGEGINVTCDSKDEMETSEVEMVEDALEDTRTFGEDVEMEDVSDNLVSDAANSTTNKLVTDDKVSDTLGLVCKIISSTEL